MKSCILFRLLLVTYPRNNASMQAIKRTQTSETLFPCMYFNRLWLTKSTFWSYQKILADHDWCIEWCKENNLPASSLKRPRAGCPNVLSWTRQASSRHGYEWRWSKRGCNGAASMPQKSWFSGSRPSIEKVLALIYPWAHKFITTQAVHETSLDDETTSTETVIDWYNYCHESSWIIMRGQ